MLYKNIFLLNDGNSIFLTIDETIQYIVERELDGIMQLHSPKKAGIVVMETKNRSCFSGWALRPAFDPNNYNDFAQVNWKNFLVSDVYEPGSTFKTVTMSGALDEGVV